MPADDTSGDLGTEMIDIQNAFSKTDTPKTNTDPHPHETTMQITEWVEYDQIMEIT